MAVFCVSTLGFNSNLLPKCTKKKCLIFLVWATLICGIWRDKKRVFFFLQIKHSDIWQKLCFSIFSTSLAGLFALKLFVLFINFIHTCTYQLGSLIDRKRKKIPTVRPNFWKLSMNNKTIYLFGLTTDDDITKNYKFIISGL